MNISNDNFQTSGWLIFLSVLIMTILLAGTALSGKMVNFGILLQPGSTVVYPLAFLLSGVVAEVYGYSISRKLIWIIIVCGYIFAFLIEGVLLLPSPADWQKAESYQDIFGYLLRFSTAGTAGIIAGLFVNSYVIAETKILVRGRYFWLRSLIAVAIGEVAHILVMVILLYWDRMTIEQMMTVMISMYLFRMVGVLVFLIPTQMLVNFLKEKEKIDRYDYDINFNPFTLK